MSIVFQHAVEAHLPAIVTLLADDYLGKAREKADLAEYRAAFLEIARDRDNAIIVGISEGRVVSCYQLTIITNLSLSATKRAQIEGVRVDTSMRGAGIGAALLRDAEERARSAGAGLLQLTMNRSREDAHRFYEANGFEASHVGFKKPL